MKKNMFESYYSILIILLFSISFSSRAQSNKENLIEYQATTLSNKRIKPNDRSEDYIKRVEYPHNISKNFNTKITDTKKIVLKGVEITLDATSNDFNNVYEKLVGNRLNPRFDLEELIIHCKKLNIIGSIKFPQTNVTINARTINFIDTDSLVSQLSTIPKQYSARNSDATKVLDAKNGLEGMASGNINLNINKILYNSNETDDSKAVRLILTGGKGQNPGEGLAGNPGRDIPSYTKAINGLGNVLWDLCNDNFKQVPCKNVIWIGNIKIGGWALQGSNIWPGDGGNAKPGGIPGIGGRGGNITLPKNTIDSRFIEVSAGNDGNKASNQIGGRAGLPNPAYKVVHNGGVKTAQVYKKHISKKGDDALAPEVENHKNSDGNITFKEEKEWLSVESVDMQLIYINDLYKSGYDSESKYLYTELYKDIKYHEKIKSEYTEDWMFHKNSALNTISKSINQINNDRDFYGYTKGWTPTLSLELMHRSYENQVNTTFNTLFLYHQILNRAKNNLNYKSKLSVQSKKETLNINRINGALDESIKKSKELDLLITPIKDSIDVYQELIKTESERLFQLASYNVENRQRQEGIIDKLKKLSGYVKVASLVFTGGQTLGGIKLISTLEEIKKNINGLNEEAKWEESELTIKKLKKLSEEINDISNIVDNLKRKKSINNSELFIEFESLKKESEYYSNLVKKCTSLVDKSKQVNLELTNIFIDIQGLIQELSTSMHNKCILENKKIMAVRYTDNELINVIQNRKQILEDKIIRFQYYLLRSFEYEFLKTYTTSFTLDKTYEEFERILSTNNDSDKYIDLTPTQINSLKSIYKQDIDNIVASGIIDLNNRGTRTTSFIEYKLSKKEIKELTSGKKLKINPLIKGLIFEKERMQRIVNIKIVQLKVKKSSYTGVIRITVKHPNESIILKDKNIYKFYHGENKYPFQWVYSYSQFNNQGLHTSNISSESLIRSLLYVDNQEYDISHSRQYALPGLISDLEVQMSLPPRSKVNLKKLRLEIEYEYEEVEN